ncbi:MAG: TIGR04283 family arsenosugar biosynthesis glycosyltransferase [Pseudomonadota bacterium]
MISIVIPVLNEAKALPKTLENILAQISDQQQIQIIVCDGGSEDNTQEIARKVENVELVIAKRGRAKQMNVGAVRATGDWLLFLHADTLLPADGLQTIHSLTEHTHIQAGCFQQQFSRDHWFLRFVSWLHNWRCNRSRIMYGDQAMFIRRRLFNDIGGFPEEQILEDVLISELIVKHTYPVLLPKTVVTSSRKFEQRGLFRSFFDIFLIMSCYELKLPIMRQGFFASFR